MRRYALVLLLVAACTQDPYERAAACEDIVSEAQACRMEMALIVGEIRSNFAAGKKTTAEESAQWKEQIEEAGKCNALKTRECELFLEDFRAGRVK